MRPGFLISFLAAATAISTPTPFDPSKIDFSKFTPEEIAATERHRDQLKGEVKDAQTKQAQVIEDQGSSIDQIKTAAAATQKSFDAYRTAAEAQIDKGNKAIAALDHVLKKLHLAKWIICAVWVLLIGLAITKVPLVAKQYALYAGAGLIAGGCAFIWLWL